MPSPAPPSPVPSPVPSIAPPGRPAPWGPTEAGRRNSPTCRPATHAHHLRLLSFNTRRAEGPPGSLKRLAHEIRALEPDLVLLQEVDRFQRRSRRVDQARVLADLLGMHDSYSPTVVRGRSQYGTLILSRHPIVDTGRIRLPGRPGVEPRALHWATVDVRGRLMNVYNTHLESVRPRLRLRQARTVLRTVRRDRRPVVVGGDLNSWPASGLVAEVSAHLTDTWSAGSGPSATGAGGRKIDYLFVGRHFTPVRSRTLPSSVSDHHRLWADVRIRVPRSCGKRGASATRP